MMAEHGKDASQRVELRERIITAATEAFTSKGIKSITMDDIAAALGISKRTLYEVFSDKESLLKECILKAQADRDKYLQKIFEQSHNVLEVILAVFQKSIEVFHQTNKRFFEDIKKYPKGFFVKFGGTSSIVNKESWLSVVCFLPYCTSAFLPL